MFVVGTSKVEMLRLRMYEVRMCRKKILKEMCHNSINNMVRGYKKHKSRQEGLDDDILNMLSEASRNEISFLKTQVMSFREREDDREREITELRDMVVNQNQVIESMKKTIVKVCGIITDMQSKMSSSQETTLYEIFDFSGFHRDAGGSGGSACSEGIQGSYGAKDKSVLEVVDDGDNGDDDGDNDQVMVYLKYDARHNVCAYLDVTDASTVGFNDALSWLSRSKDSHAISFRVTEDTIREVLNNGDERRHKINANMDDIIACFNRMGYVGNFKKDLVIKTMLSRE
ncbi:hypothetical protein L1987_23992 [Smallanthus sonchifolius]|uniref:Uncharacterized protein n=1 Tax=Smallanthus sonchifolius TaxID=185202 RepID=A0ACB9IKN2_9ASTR|nr:hypothetical protein L1987_23992 [Smallanthus sonchifolius]